jgi:hypothetical protein
MAITDKTRKLLWGRSGNRCSICDALLSFQSESKKDIVLGEECHIISKQANGPRHDPKNKLDDYDNYDNLILLCSTHHKIIDEQTDEYTVEKLKEIKQKHITSIQEKLSETIRHEAVRLVRSKKNIPEYLHRITNGNQLCTLINGSYASYTYNDELTSETEVELVGNFFQEVLDWIDLYDIVEPLDRIKSSFLFSRLIEELESNSFYVFGGFEIQTLTGGISNSNEPFKVLIVFVLRSTNPSIVYKTETIDTSSALS